MPRRCESALRDRNRCSAGRCAASCVAAHQVFQDRAHVGQQRILPFVEEDGCRRVQRLQVNDAVADAALAHDVVIRSVTLMSCRRSLVIQSTTRWKILNDDDGAAELRLPLPQ